MSASDAECSNANANDTANDSDGDGDNGEYLDPVSSSSKPLQGPCTNDVCLKPLLLFALQH